MYEQCYTQIGVTRKKCVQIYIVSLGTTDESWETHPHQKTQPPQIIAKKLWGKPMPHSFFPFYLAIVLGLSHLVNDARMEHM